MATLGALVLSGCDSAPSASSGGNGSGTGDEFGSMSTLADLVKDKRGQHQSAHMTMVITTAGESFTAEGDVLFGDNLRLETTLRLPETAPVTARLVDGVAYVRYRDKPWMKVDTEGKLSARTVGGAVQRIKAYIDPAQLVPRLARSGRITGRTTETVRGEQVTRHVVTVDVRKAAAEQTDPEFKKTMDEAGAAGATTFPVEVWLNKDELPVRTVAEIPVKNSQTGQSTKTKVTVDYQDWGKLVDITAPPASDVG
ncbi:MAG TPA: hypothetical protein VFV67_26920 [Actinophytocola sp.]|uniref:hypothetical protein n=1 Tax=Actinophytocola sp. TaxID=1872138 RepID=UPI002DB6A23D|nr:hypothetical protein [Actinophytocola sp.]HEU5474297.1 hypothetical protein [Actinophytocola sp.]